MPGEFARVDIEGHRRVGVQVVARTRLRIVLRNGVTRAPDGEARRGIVRPGLPDAVAARLPRVIFVLPCFASWIAWFGYDIPSPQLLACSRFHRRNPAPSSSVSGAVCNEDLVLNGDRRCREFFA